MITEGNRIISDALVALPPEIIYSSSEREYTRKY